MNQCHILHLGEFTYTDDKLSQVYLIKGTAKNQETQHHVFILDLSCQDELGQQKYLADMNELLLHLSKRKHQYVSVILLQQQKATCLATRVLCHANCDEFMALLGVILTISVCTDGVSLSAGLTTVINLLGNNDNEITHVVLLSHGKYFPINVDFVEEQQQGLSLMSKLSKLCNNVTVIGIDETSNDEYLALLTQTSGASQFERLSQIKNKQRFVNQLIKRLSHSFKAPVYILNESYFLVQASAYMTTSQVLQLTIPQLILTFDGPLQCSISQKIGHDALSKEQYETIIYSLAREKFLKKETDEVVKLLHSIGCDGLIHQVRHCYSQREYNHLLQHLTQLVLTPNKRLQKQFRQPKDEQQLTVLEVLHKIVQDPASQFLWDMRQCYRRTSYQTIDIEDDYQFCKPKVGFCEASLQISETKQNVRLNVKVIGQVEHQPTGLKKDAYIYRNYLLIHQGNLVLDELYCVLSESLKTLFRKHRLIKHQFTWDKKEISVLRLEKLLLLHPRIISSYQPSLTLDQMIQLQTLKCKKWGINQQLKQLDLTKDTHQIDAFRILKSGRYVSIQTDFAPGPYYLTGIERVMSWSLHRFSETKKKHQAKEQYCRLVDETDQMYETRLLQELEQMKHQIKQLTFDIQFTRLSCSLLKVTYFTFDRSSTKAKKQQDAISKQPLIVNNTMVESIAFELVHPVRQQDFEIYKRI